LGAWERLLEATRGVGKLFFLLLRSPSSIEIFFPFGLERMIFYEIGGRDTNERRNWSMKQSPRLMGEGCFYFIVSISSYSSFL